MVVVLGNIISRMVFTSRFLLFLGGWLYWGVSSEIVIQQLKSSSALWSEIKTVSRLRTVQDLLGDSGNGLQYPAGVDGAGLDPGLIHDRLQFRKIR